MNNQETKSEPIKLPTLKESYYQAINEANSLNVDVDALFANRKEKAITLKRRIEMLRAANAEQSKKLSAEISAKLDPQNKDAESSMPSGKVQLVSNTPEGRSKILSDLRKTINQERK